MTSIDKMVARRRFLQGALTAAGSIAAVPALQGLSLLGAHGRVQASPGKGGYGPLIPTPDLRDGVMRMPYRRASSTAPSARQAR